MNTTKSTLNEKEMELVRNLVSECKRTGDIQEKLKRLFAGTIEQMMEAEMEEHLGYEKNSIAGNSRNGYGKKTIISGPPDPSEVYPLSGIQFREGQRLTGRCPPPFYRTGRVGLLLSVTLFGCFAVYSDLLTVKPLTRFIFQTLLCSYVSIRRIRWSLADFRPLSVVALGEQHCQMEGAFTNTLDGTSICSTRPSERHVGTVDCLGL